MTRKDYRLLALAIAQDRLDKRNLDRLLKSLISALEMENPRFNQALFDTTVRSMDASLKTLGVNKP